MKLEFEQNIISKELFKELDFISFLNLFDFDLPIIPGMILHPLDKLNGIKHFEELTGLSKSIQNKNLEFDKLLKQARKLPFLDYLLPFFEQKSLEQIHLYQLGTFITENLILEEYEKYEKKDHSKASLEIKKILELHTTDEFKEIRFTSKEDNLKKSISDLENETGPIITDYENNIFKQTELKMIYPYPREISKEHPLFEKIKKCKLLSIKQDENFWRVSYIIPDQLEKLNSKIKNHTNQFSISINKKLQLINTGLSKHYDQFKRCYQLRKKRLFNYALIFGAKKHGLCIPEFDNKSKISFQNARLPLLDKLKKDHYIPLSLTLNKGSNVLFGSNMSGKTTVLKTIFFHLMTIKFGLPVPADSISLSFPEQVELHLKSSGNIKKNISSFGEEMQFFAKKMNSGSFILVDEFFQTTNPVGGALLSKIFLEEFLKKDMVFFCNSQYPETLQVKEVCLFRMKDIPLKEKQNIKLGELMDKMPYIVEKISKDLALDVSKEMKRTLCTALCFPLEESIKQKIRGELNLLN